jgi:hypothetical protein
MTAGKNSRTSVRNDRAEREEQPLRALRSGDDSAVLLLNKSLVILAIRAAAREDDSRLLSIRLQSLIHEDPVVIRVQAQKCQGELLA